MEKKTETTVGFSKTGLKSHKNFILLTKTFCHLEEIQESEMLVVCRMSVQMRGAWAWGI